MDTPGYTTITRQSGLLREMQVIAHNIANLSTTGFRREGVVFAELVQSMPDGGPSLSMAFAHGRITSQQQGEMISTGGDLDFAIDGAGFFVVETPDGQRMTRAGHFLRGPEGELVTPQGHLLLDNGGGPIIVPPDAGMLALGPDGTLTGDLGPIAQIGVFTPEDPMSMRRQVGQLFTFDGNPQPVEEARILHRHLEGSNVEPMNEVARMIEVQRAYELGQRFLDREDERIRGVIQTLGR
jgi:flagellar basal-body rod protein FlgF